MEHETTGHVDEPILGESVPISPAEMEAVGIPESERAEVSTGED